MRILVTYGWCRTAYIAAESICRAGFEVYACGSTALSMVRVSRLVRGFDRVPDPFKEPEQLVELRASALETDSARLLTSGFFPAYRALP
ncbi:hypothetical protein QUB56_24440 [Microcoleus sp. AR_TQ3_B6]|uniref:hypothetical protein n=1 Tax=Microcoleus sp. AR_TQ3_B6 TaxID=3055284 RepID=UPI002FD51B7D